MKYKLDRNEYYSILYLMNSIWSFSNIHENPTKYILDDCEWFISFRY